MLSLKERVCAGGSSLLVCNCDAGCNHPVAQSLFLFLG